MINESIFDNGGVVIPMADVQNVEYVRHPTIGANGIFVITKHSRWDMQADTWANPIYIPEQGKEAFLKAWCQYRHEAEGVGNGSDRSQFAAMAMQGYIASYAGIPDAPYADDVATKAVKFADALIKELEK